MNDKRMYVDALSHQLELIKDICIKSNCDTCIIREMCLAKLSGCPDVWDISDIRKYAELIMSLTEDDMKEAES